MASVVRRSEEKAQAEKRWVANMAKPAFVKDLLRDAGINKPPCFFCRRQQDGTCGHTVGDLECKDYILYSNSPEKVEIKFLNYVNIQRQKKAVKPLEHKKKN